MPKSRQDAVNGVAEHHDAGCAYGLGKGEARRRSSVPEGLSFGLRHGVFLEERQHDTLADELSARPTELEDRQVGR